MSKNFEEELLGLIKGLDEINRNIHNSEKRFAYSRAIHARQIQEVRIEFFKLGYRCRDNELKQQRTL